MDPISYTVCYVAYFYLSFQVKMYFSEDSSTTTDTDTKNADIDPEYAPSTSSESHFPTEKELNNLIRI